MRSGQRTAKPLDLAFHEAVEDRPAEEEELGRPDCVAERLDSEFSKA